MAKGRLFSYKSAAFIVSRKKRNLEDPKFENRNSFPIPIIPASVLSQKFVKEVFLMRARFGEPRESLCENAGWRAVAALYERRSASFSDPAVIYRRYKSRFSHKLVRGGIE